MGSHGIIRKKLLDIAPPDCANLPWIHAAAAAAITGHFAGTVAVETATVTAADHRAVEDFRATWHDVRRMWLLSLFARKPWVAALFGGVAACGFAYLGHGAWEDLQRYEAGPTTLSLSDAVARAGTDKVYARVEDMRLDCDAALVDALRRPSVFVPVLDGSGQAVAVADYDQHVDCRLESTRPLVGIFSSLRERMRNKLVDAGMTLRSPNVRHLCTYCGAANSRTGVIVCASLVLVALFLFPLSLLMNRKLQTQAHRPVSVGEIRAAGGLFVAAAGVLAYFGQGWALYGLVPVYWVSIVAGLIGSAMIVAPRNRLVQERVARFQPRESDQP